MVSYKCEFCEHHTGPNKPKPENCVKCVCGTDFQMKTKLHPDQLSKWKRHQRFDRFINECVDNNIIIWQRELLHQTLDNEIIFARGCGRSIERIRIAIVLDFFHQIEEKERKK